MPILISPRICHLLEVWIQDYPHDFVVGAAADALNALIKSIVTKTHLLHYGSDLLPFLEGRPLRDKDSAWAMKVDEPTSENDDDDDDVLVVIPIRESPSTQTQLSEEARATRPQLPSSVAERKSSFPLGARSNGNTADQADSVKEVLKNLLITSARLGNCEPLQVAEEITRVGKRLFLQIEVGIIFTHPWSCRVTFGLPPSHETGCTTCWFPERKIPRPILLYGSMRCLNIWQIGSFHTTLMARLPY
jgi:hypothetical protein